MATAPWSSAGLVSTEPAVFWSKPKAAGEQHTGSLFGAMSFPLRQRCLSQRRISNDALPLSSWRLGSMHIPCRAPTAPGASITPPRRDIRECADARMTCPAGGVVPVVGNDAVEGHHQRSGPVEAVPQARTHRYHRVAWLSTDLRRLIDAVYAGSTSRDSMLHGEGHWKCVAWTGSELADHVPRCDRAAVLLFALLHDTQRLNDGHDPGHGPRAASFARDLHARGLIAPPAETLELLC